MFSLPILSLTYKENVQWYSLPGFNSVARAMEYGVHLSYKGCFRIVIEEKVTKWEMEDLKRAKWLKKVVRN